MSVRSKIQACKDILLNGLVKNKPPFKVMSIEETIDRIIDGNLSVSRYGDGEVFMMADQMNDSFQTYSKDFAKKLKKVAESRLERHIVCIPDIFDDLSKYTDRANIWFKWFLKRKKYLFYRYFDVNYLYGNAFITRPYMDLKNKSVSNRYYELLKKVWMGKDILIVEGQFSRLGVGNNLFRNARSIRRILCPAVNAYEYYDEILNVTEHNVNGGLVLIALGGNCDGSCVRFG